MELRDRVRDALPELLAGGLTPACPRVSPPRNHSPHGRPPGGSELQQAVLTLFNTLESLVKIRATDRGSIEAGFLVRSSYALVSITDPGAELARVPRVVGCRAVLRLAFHDATPGAGAMEMAADVEVMRPEHARAIAEFAVKHRADVGAFVVHCEAGMSRSPAVAAAIAEYLGDDPGRFFDRYQPNAWVHTLTREAFGLDVNYDAKT